VVRVGLMATPATKPPAAAALKLTAAVSNSRLDEARALLEQGANPDVSPTSMPPISFACGNGNLAMVKLLIEHGASIETADKEHNRSPLAWAAGGSKKGCDACTQLLIEKKAAVNRADNEGSTPLLEATKTGLLRSLQLLLSAGAEKDVVAGNNTPLDWAMVMYREEQEAMLRKWRAKRNPDKVPHCADGRPTEEWLLPPEFRGKK